MLNTLNQQAAPGELRDTQALQQQLFQTGQSATTGSIPEFLALQESQGQNALGRQLAAIGAGQQAQQQQFGFAQQNFQNQAMLPQLRQQLLGSNQNLGLNALQGQGQFFNQGLDMGNFGLNRAIATGNQEIGRGANIADVLAAGGGQSAGGVARGIGGLAGGIAGGLASGFGF